MVHALAGAATMPVGGSNLPGYAAFRSDTDIRPNCTLNWLPPAGESAMVRVRLIYIRRDQEFGQWSDWASYALSGQ